MIRWIKINEDLQIFMTRISEHFHLTADIFFSECEGTSPTEYVGEKSEGVMSKKETLCNSHLRVWRGESDNEG